jgi:DNA-binding MurR/RpiR family transcriptional regulator
VETVEKRALVEANRSFVVSARGAGPFDSQVGTLALVQSLVTGVASRLRKSATERLDAIEEAWRTGDELVER